MIREEEDGMEVVAGIDVGKFRLDVWAGAGPVQRFDNSTEGIAALAQWLGEQNVSMAVCEPTGGYERLLISQLEEAGSESIWPIPTRCGPSPGPAGTKRRPTAWTPRSCPGSARCLP